MGGGNEIGENVKQGDVLFRASDLVLPASASCHEEMRWHRGAKRCRRELVLMYGGEEAGRACWESAESDDGMAMTFASCVRGHLLHARCFQGRLIAGSGCPVCSEPLFVPQVQHTEQNSDGDCCGVVGESTPEPPPVEADLAVARGDRVAAAFDVSASQTGTLQMKMCPACCAGPLINENCSDLRQHHGECPRCRQVPKSGPTIEEALASRTAPNVFECIPRCENCDIPVIFNGCASCGHLFTDMDWRDLPAWDPSAMACLEVTVRHRRAARLLAAQVRSEAARFVHERTALDDALTCGQSLVEVADAEPPPPPRSLRQVSFGSEFLNTD